MMPSLADMLIQANQKPAIAPTDLCPDCMTRQRLIGASGQRRRRCGPCTDKNAEQTYQKHRENKRERRNARICKVRGRARLLAHSPSRPEG